MTETLVKINQSYLSTTTQGINIPALESFGIIVSPSEHVSLLKVGAYFLAVSNAKVRMGVYHLRNGQQPELVAHSNTVNVTEITFTKKEFNFSGVNLPKLLFGNYFDSSLFILIKFEVLEGIVKFAHNTVPDYANSTDNVLIRFYNSGMSVPSSNNTFTVLPDVNAVHFTEANLYKGVQSAQGNGYYELTLGPANNVPTISITSPTVNQTLYENDTLSIAGTASDSDAGNSVTVRYQINVNTPRAIKAFISTGVAEAFSKNLTFSGGSFYDGQTLIASGLVDGVPHTLKVWATDDQGGTSAIVERTFYVVPNRTPLLTVDTPVINGLIDNDEIEITGTYSDPDGNNATVAYRINGGNSVQVAAGTSGNYDFKIRFGQLKVGLNNIVIEVTDSYGAKASKTVKLQKDEVAVEQLKSTARYRIIPPLGTATGVVVWVQRDENLALNASISMTLVGEVENFVAMTKTKTAPMPNSPGIVEDQFQFENATAAESIILQLDLEKSALGANERIHAITGVVD